MTPSYHLPWSSSKSWTQALLSLEMSMHTSWEKLTSSRTIAAQLEGLYRQVDLQLDAVCTLTCPDCNDNCCRRATVWYDLRDLLSVFFITGHFPTAQIKKSSTNQCRHLSSMGCLLPRVERPFICTWYICSEQRQKLDTSSSLKEKTSLLVDIQQIKQARGELEKAFIKAVC